jgi:predicted dehydrogenase
MASPLQFAILGCGKIAPRHAAEACKHGQLAAVCDIIPEKAQLLSAAYNCRSYTSIDELFGKETIDIVAVCTPNGLHAEHSIKALKAGIHVLCEKPLSTSTQDGLRMTRASEETGKKLFVVKSTRYNPALAKLKQAIGEGKLGKIFSFQLNCFWNRPAEYYAGSWKGDQRLDGGTLFTQFSHYIDALLWLFGDIKSVSGWRKNLAHHGIIDFEDSGVAAIDMQNGMIGGLNWSVNTFQKNMEVSLSILAENASLQIAGEYMNHVTYQAGDLGIDVPQAGIANDYGYYKGSMSNHDKIYENLVKVLYDDAHPFANAADGLRTVEAIEKIYQSVIFNKQ